MGHAGGGKFGAEMAPAGPNSQQRGGGGPYFGGGQPLQSMGSMMPRGPPLHIMGHMPPLMPSSLNPHGMGHQFNVVRMRRKLL